MSAQIDEIKRLQDTSTKVMLFGFGIVGSVISTTDSFSESTVIGSGFIVVVSLVYIISAATKIFIISAFLSLHSESDSKWHKALPRISDQFVNWFETQNIAVIYFLVAVFLLIVFYPAYPLYAAVLFSVEFGLVLFLYFIPTKLPAYQKRMEALKEHIR